MAVQDGASVRTDIDTLNDYLKSYNTQVGDLAGKWEGNSYEALNKEATAFSSECEKIGQGMESFAKACDKYNNEFLAAKEKKKDREQHLADAKANDVDGSNKDLINTYASEVDAAEKEMKRIKKEIETLLSEAASVKIKGAQSFMSLGNLSISNTIASNGQNYMMLNFDPQKVSNKFGSQLDNKGIYGYDGSGCDDYARGYCIYIQSGIAPSKQSVSVNDSKSGLKSHQISAKNRDDQARIAFELLEKGKPSVIHINSPSTGSGAGHWVTVVGCRQGVTKDTVKIEDLVIMDPVTGTVRAITEDKEYCRKDLGRCRAEPGYHINYYA